MPRTTRHVGPKPQENHMSNKNNRQPVIITPEWPEDCRKGGTQWSALDRRRYVQEVGTKIGLNNLPRSELAAMMGCHRITIMNTINSIYKAGLPKDLLETATLNIKNALETALEVSHGMTKASSGRERLQAAQVAIDAARANTEFLEKFGVKNTNPIEAAARVEVVWMTQSAAAGVRVEVSGAPASTRVDNNSHLV
jgi:hypothetical protein